MSYVPQQNSMIINICQKLSANLTYAYWMWANFLTCSSFHEYFISYSNRLLHTFMILSLAYYKSIYQHLHIFITLPSFSCLKKKNPESFMNYILINELELDQKAYAIWLQSIACHWNNLGPLRRCVTISSYYTSKVSSLTLCEEYSLSSMRNRSLDLATLSGVLPSLSTDLRLVPVRETVYYIYMTLPVETPSLNWS